MLPQTNDPGHHDEADGAARILACANRVLTRTPSAHQLSRPRITLSYAQSLDGCIAAGTGTTTRISNIACQRFTHRLRSIHDAILVGVMTVLVDDPRLNVRLVSGNDPIPIILDSRLRTPPESQVLRNGSIIFTTPGASPARAARLADAGAQIAEVSAGPDGRVDLPEVFACLVARGFRSVMVEGGADVITSIMLGSFADQLVLTVARMVLGGVRAVGTMTHVPFDLRPKLANVTFGSLGGDLLVHGEFERPA